MKRIGSSGFTLIEVLIALAIIAIACTAIIRSVNQSVYTSARLKNETIAHWVALNALAEIQDGLQTKPTSYSTVSGIQNMWHRQWHWSASFKTSTRYGLEKIMIVVNQPASKKPLISMAGFIWNPQINGGRNA